MRTKVVWVLALGGVAGATTRWALIELLDANSTWPWATFSANILGCLVLGVLVGRFGSLVDSGWMIGATAGFCGALTTFSGFAVELAVFARSNSWSLLAGYLAASLIGGLAAFQAGRRVAQAAPPGVAP